jgi:internalin A
VMSTAMTERKVLSRARILLTLLILAIVAGGLALGILGKRSAEQRAMVARIVAAGGMVEIATPWGLVLLTRGGSAFPLVHLAGEIVAIRTGNAKLDEADIRSIAQLRLETLHLLGNHTTDADIAALRQMPRLEYLWVTGPQVTDAAMAHIGEMKSLHILYLTGTSVTDAGLAHLKHLAHLHSLRIDSPKVTDAGMTHLQKLPLEVVSLNGASMTDAGVASLTPLSRLKRLILSGPAITDASIESLRQMADLEILSLDDTSVTAEGLKSLSSLARLQRLHVPSSIRPEEVAELEGILGGVTIKKPGE